MTKDEALDLALEALRDALDKPMWDRVQMEVAITAIKQARSAPVQEPVGDDEIAAWAERHDIQGSLTDLRSMFEDAASLTTPPAAQPAPVQPVAFEVGLVEWVGNKLMATPKVTATPPASWRGNP
jgi:hypothetical protein